MQHEQEQDGVAGPRREVGGALEQGGRGVVGIVEHEQRRTLAPVRGADRLECHVGGPGARGVDHGRGPPLDLGGELGGEPGLADARRTEEERQPGVTGLGIRPALPQPAQLALAPGEQRRSSVELGRELDSWRRRIESRILPQDGFLELAQLGPGAGPDLLDQDSARLAIRIHRRGLAAGAVEGEHSLSVEALVEGMLGEK